MKSIFDKWSILTITFTLIYILILEMLQPYFFLWDDNINVFHTYYAYNWRALTEYQTLPLYNFHQYLGQPYLAQGQTGVFYIPSYIATALSFLISDHSYWTIEILVALHFLIGALAFFKLSLNFGVRAELCCLLSLLWITTPFLTLMSKSWVNVSYTVAYTPLIFLLLDLFLTRRQIKIGFILIMVKTIFFYQGYIQWIFLLQMYEAVYLGLYLASRGAHSKLTIMKSYLLLHILYLCLIAPLLFPMWLAQIQSAERAIPLNYFDFLKMHVEPGEFLKALLFKFDVSRTIKLNTCLLYLSPILMVSLALLGFRKFRRKISHKHAIFASLTILSGILCSELHGLLYFVPPFNFFRWPFKHFIFFSFFLNIICVLTVNLATGYGPQFKRALLLFLIICVALNVSVVLTHSTVTMAQFRSTGPLQDPFKGVIDSDQGRVATFQTLKAGAPDYLGYPLLSGYKYLTFVYATLFNYHHLGGQDPLVSKMHKELALGAQYINSYELDLSVEVLRHWSKVGVRFVITSPTTEHLQLPESFPALKFLYKDAQVLIFENINALPIAYPCNNPNISLPVRFYINHLEIESALNSNSELCLTLAPGSFQASNPKSDDAFQLISDDMPLRFQPSAGTDLVQVAYHDRQFVYGLIFFALSILVTLGLKAGGFLKETF